ncbi:MAG: transcription termination factor NusA [bacterium]
MNKELLESLGQIEREKDIKPEELVGMVEQALMSAFRRHLHTNQNVEVSINRQTGEIKAYILKKVVEKVTNENFELSLKEAKKLKPKVKIDDTIKISFDTKEFGRIAAQTAKQVIIQRLRETERTHLYEEFKQKEGEVLNGVVQRFLKKATIVDLGKIEAVLPYREQVPYEKFQIGERIKVFVLEVVRTTKGPEIIVSRTHPELVKKLFEVEVPEIYEHIVEIKQVVREPGIRSKIAVVSHKDKVDPVGACVGVKGSRIRGIIDELRGERIDIIPWNEDPSVFIAKALSPAEVTKVSLDPTSKKANVLVPDDKLSLAIGKGGQNVRLAVKLTGWHIDVKGVAQAAQAKEKQLADYVAILSQLPGVGEKTAQELVNIGLATLVDIAGAKIEDLMKVSGIGEKKAEKIKEAAVKLIQDQGKKNVEPATEPMDKVPPEARADSEEQEADDSDKAEEKEEKDKGESEEKNEDEKTEEKTEENNDNEQEEK